MVLVSIKDNNSANINMEIILLLVLRKNLQYRHILMVLSRLYWLGAYFISGYILDKFCRIHTLQEKQVCTDMLVSNVSLGCQQHSPYFFFFFFFYTAHLPDKVWWVCLTEESLTLHHCFSKKINSSRLYFSKSKTLIKSVMDQRPHNLNLALRILRCGLSIFPLLYLFSMKYFLTKTPWQYYITG